MNKEEFYNIYKELVKEVEIVSKEETKNNNMSIVNGIIKYINYLNKTYNIIIF